MKISTSLLLFLAIAYGGICQNVGIGTNSPLARFHVADSNVLFTGQYPVPSTTIYGPSVSGPGTRFQWYSQKGALRVGSVENDAWDALNTGVHSIAMGASPMAKGANSISLGRASVAIGTDAACLGAFNSANGAGSAAVGYFNTIDGAYSYCMGRQNIANGNDASCVGFDNLAGGLRSVSIGYLNASSGNNSSSMGTGNGAQGELSISLGSYNLASGYGSSAIGQNTRSVGIYTTSLGFVTRASSFASTAIGTYNDTIAGSSRNSWVATDPLLMVGNGSSSLATSNAMTIYKNGDADLNGYTKLGSDAPAIKMKKFTLSSASTQGGDAFVVHGLNRSKILGVQALLSYDANGDVPPGFNDSPGYEYNVSLMGDRVYIWNTAANSANILSKPVRVILTYEE